MVRQTSELETNVVAVERTKEYSETPNEVECLVDAGDGRLLLYYIRLQLSLRTVVQILIGQNWVT